MIVLDASAAVAYLIEAGAEGEWARATIAGEPDIAAPHLIDVEVSSGLRKLVGRGEVTRPRAEQALADYDDMELLRYPAFPLLERIWQLRAGLTAYDAAYVALSEALEAPLLTVDQRLARGGGHRAVVLAYGT